MTRVLLTLALAISTAALAAQSDGWVSIFDGKTLDGWKASENPATFRVENGTIVVLKAGPEIEVLAKNDVGNSVIATPAIADNRLYVRTYDTLWCFEEPAQ